MRYQIDQSGKIEDTAKDTVIAYSNSTQRAVLIPRKLKRQIQETLRRCGIIRLFIYSLFSTGIYHLIKDLKQASDITIDTEYPGKDKLITTMIKLLLEKNEKPQHHIHFARIGNRPKAHYAAKDVFDKKIPPNYILSLTEAIRTLKKTDGRLRECLATLVDARSRSYKGKISQKFKKVNRKSLQKGFIKLTKRTLVMLLIFSILLPSLTWVFLFKLPKKTEAAWPPARAFRPGGRV